ERLDVELAVRVGLLEVLLSDLRTVDDVDAESRVGTRRGAEERERRVTALAGAAATAAVAVVGRAAGSKAEPGCDRDRSKAQAAGFADHEPSVGYEVLQPAGSPEALMRRNLASVSDRTRRPKRGCRCRVAK